VHLKTLSFLANQNSVFLPVFFCAKPTVLGVLVGFCWPIRVTAALLGRLLPSDGHKLVKKPGNLGPKVPQIVHFLAGRIFLKFVWWAAVLPKSTVDNFW
jgi:hypothetical protein